jgi:hypothetical protein
MDDENLPERIVDHVVRQLESETSNPKFNGLESAGCMGAATAGVRRRASNGLT